MIDLAPGWKKSLTLEHPAMIVTRAWNASPVGALVTPALTARARAGAPLPRVIELPGGMLLRTGAANPGVERFVHAHGGGWAKSSVPIIVALAAQAVDDWGAIAARLERVEGVGGVELHLNPTIDAASTIRRTRMATNLPILAQLDLENARTVAADCVAAGANALVISRPPRGAVYRAEKLWHGRMHGAMVKPLALQTLVEIRELKLDVPLVACGGIHSSADAREFLSAGAAAFEIDTAHWVDAELVARMCEEMVR